MPVFKNCQRTAASDINILKWLTPNGEQKQLEEDTVWKQKILKNTFSERIASQFASQMSF